MPFQKGHKLGVGKQYWLGKKHSEETKILMSLFNKRTSLGKKVSIETKLKMKLSHIGKKRTPFSNEHKNKLSESAKKRMGILNPFYGKKHTTKSILNMRLSRMKKCPEYDGKHKNKLGYILISNGKGKFRLEHRLIIENKIGRKLENKEIIHHINGNTSDNRIENLAIMEQGEHLKLHLNRVIVCPTEA